VAVGALAVVPAVTVAVVPAVTVAVTVALALACVSARDAGKQAAIHASAASGGRCAAMGLV
jgi:hypothetical protein